MSRTPKFSVGDRFVDKRGDGFKITGHDPDEKTITVRYDDGLEFAVPRGALVGCVREETP